MTGANDGLTSTSASAASPQPQPQPQPQLAYSGEDQKANSAYRAASDPVRQAAHAAPITANVPFMYNNTHGPSRVEIGSAEAGPVTYGVTPISSGVQGNLMLRLADSYFQSAPSREQVRAKAEGRQGSIDFGGPSSPLCADQGRPESGIP